jgi:integrase
MSVTIFDDGFIRMTAQYVKALKGGILYYYRRIPKDVKEHLGGRTFRKVSLGTRDLKTAIRAASPLISRDEALWQSLRSAGRDGRPISTRETREAALAILAELGLQPGAALREYPDGVPTPIEALNDYFESRYGEAFSEALYNDGRQPDDATINELLTPPEREAVKLVKEDPTTPRRLLSDARDTYLENHPKGQQPKFVQGVEFAVNQVIEAVGDLPLQDYRRKDAVKVRDHLLARDIKTASVRRRINAIKAVINSGIVEFDLQRTAVNPFEKLKIRNEKTDATKREDFTPEELAIIAPACIAADDDIRHIVAIDADTGGRLGEVVGLRIEDVVLDAEVPHLDMRPYEHLGRTLKNAQSRRKVPLLGLALWGATRAVQDARGRGQSKGWLFPRYAADHDISHPCLWHHQQMA